MVSFSLSLFLDLPRKSSVLSTAVVLRCGHYLIEGFDQRFQLAGSHVTELALV
jgi:hypothetical protein